MTRTQLDLQIAGLARRQHGAFATRQVLALGGDHSLVRRRVASGAWVRLDHAVYALPGNPGTWRRQAKAAELGHPAAVLAGGSAAVLHGLPGFRPGRPEIVVPASTRYASSIASVRRRSDIEWTMADGLRVTTLAQTLVDIARRSSDAAVERAVEHVVLTGAIDLGRLDAYGREAADRKAHGAARLRAVVDELLRGGAVSESELERWLRRALRQAGIEGAVFQAAPPWWPSGAARLDALVPSCTLIVEADGRAWHARVADFERDRERDNLAVAHGYGVLRLTWAMLTRRFEGTVELLRTAAARRDRVGSLWPAADGSDSDSTKTQDQWWAGMVVGRRGGACVGAPMRQGSSVVAMRADAVALAGASSMRSAQ